jgi:hypothetical protein
MLERGDSHERHRFADLEDLCTFLREQANEVTWLPKTTGEE